MVFLSSRELSSEDEEVKIFIYLFKLKSYGWVVDVFSVFLFIEQIKSYSLDGFLADVHENVLECIKISFKKWCLNEKKDNFRIRTFDRLHVTKCIWAIDDIFL